MVGADRPRTDEGQSANQQQRPDEQLTVLQFIRGPGDDDHGDGGRRYGTEESQPTSTIPIFSPPLRIIDGSHSTKPYTPILRAKYCAQSRITLRERKASP